MDDLSVSYGHISALKGVSLEVMPGEIVVLIGANGAGKTTLLETVLGINTPVTGSIIFNGASIGGLAADRNVRAGLCLVPEGRGVFASMTSWTTCSWARTTTCATSPSNLKRVYEWFPDPGEAAGTRSRAP